MSHSRLEAVAYRVAVPAVKNVMKTYVRNVNRAAVIVPRGMALLGFFNSPVKIIENKITSLRTRLKQQTSAKSCDVFVPDMLAPFMIPVTLLKRTAKTVKKFIWLKLFA